MTETRLQEMGRIVVAALAPYREHRDWEDLVQEGWIAAWQQCDRLEGHAAWTTIAWNAARWRAGSVLREPGTRLVLGPTRYRPGAAPAVAVTWLEEWREWGEPVALESGYAAIEDRMEQAAHWRGLRAVCTARQWQAVRLHLGEGLPLPVVARRLGISANGADSLIRWGLNAYRRVLGLPERGRGQAASRQRDRKRAAAKKRRPA